MPQIICENVAGYTAFLNVAISSSKKSFMLLVVGREDDCFITPLSEGEHSIRFVLKEEGTHYLLT